MYERACDGYLELFAGREALGATVGDRLHGRPDLLDANALVDIHPEEIGLFEIEVAAHVVVEAAADRVGVGHRPVHGVGVSRRHQRGQAADRVHGEPLHSGADPQPGHALGHVPVGVPPWAAGVAVGPVRHGHPDVAPPGQLLVGERRPPRTVELVPDHRGDRHRGERQVGERAAQEPHLVDQHLRAGGHVRVVGRLDVDRVPVQTQADGGDHAGEVDLHVEELRQVPTDDLDLLGPGPGDDRPEGRHVEDRGRVPEGRGLDVERLDARRRQAVHVGHAQRCRAPGEGGRPVVDVPPRAQAHEGLGTHDVRALAVGELPGHVAVGRHRDAARHQRDRRRERDQRRQGPAAPDSGRSGACCHTSTVPVRLRRGPADATGHGHG